MAQASSCGVSIAPAPLPGACEEALPTAAATASAEVLARYTAAALDLCDHSLEHTLSALTAAAAQCSSYGAECPQALAALEHAEALLATTSRRVQLAQRLLALQAARTSSQLPQPGTAAAALASCDGGGTSLQASLTQAAQHLLAQLHALHAQALSGAARSGCSWGTQPDSEDEDEVTSACHPQLGVRTPLAAP